MINNIDFKSLIEAITQTHQVLQQQSVKAVNVRITVRNWLIGCYIVEFEQRGKDRAKYKSKLLEKLAKGINIKGLTSPELSRCRQFYQVYPEILGTLSQEFTRQIFQSISANLIPQKILVTMSQKSCTVVNPSENINHHNEIISKVSYSHFVELIKIENETKRNYYELLILKTNLSVRELRRQIDTLSYERLGLSSDKTNSFKHIADRITPSLPEHAVKSHYFFDFLEINSPHIIEETQLEQAMIEHLQQFIIELGNGFCFEARQKRILIGEEYFFVDLVFYHRILKSHVLIELKVDKFNHAHASQLVTYLNFYKKNMMEIGDNPPIGILLVTDKNSALVEYAAANDNDRLFVSKYKLILPSEEELKAFIENELRQ
jgi:predicted nuclease of restriction endonuclease-like (RecB) superfamily